MAGHDVILDSWRQMCDEFSGRAFTAKQESARKSSLAATTLKLYPGHDRHPPESYRIDSLNEILVEKYPDHAINYGENDLVQKIGEVLAAEQVEVEARTTDAHIASVLDAETGCLTVQHVATGLRARFDPPRDKSSIWSVLAKPYDVNPIVNSRFSGSESAVRFTGLGVGRKIYLRAAEQLPEARFRDEVSHDRLAARGLRTRLHAMNPYRWHDKTCACNPSWQKALAATMLKTCTSR